MNKQQLRIILLEDPRRQVQVNGCVCHCEGMAYQPHVCQGALDRNEILITQRVFQKIDEKKKSYFFHEYNCSLNCRYFHRQFGHSKGYRDWFFDRVCDIYGRTHVDTWVENAPLKIRRI